MICLQSLQSCYFIRGLIVQAMALGLEGLSFNKYYNFTNKFIQVIKEN